MSLYRYVYFEFSRRSVAVDPIVGVAFGRFYTRSFANLVRDAVGTKG